ncbi:hypothetical protein [Metapseudomonas otitidis]|uniref:hypothetical protein n=1 Tax=Metapseudomonas otitidis TaxID=319939 RepID=UPI001F2DF481|nr:hypothetical protein [Pseudomonas otitidis]
MSTAILKGTEKQVTWATDIRDKVVRGIELLRTEMLSYLQDERQSLGAEGIADLMAFYEDGLQAILDNGSAAFWIDNRWMARWADLKPGTPLARTDAFGFMHEYNQRNASLYKQVLLRAKFNQDVKDAREAARGTINSQEEWDAANAALSQRFGKGSRFEALATKSSTEGLEEGEDDEYRTLLVEYSAATCAMQDFVKRSGAYERLRLGGALCDDD